MIMNSERPYYELSQLSKEDQFKVIISNFAATGFAKKSNDDAGFCGIVDMYGESFHNCDDRNYIMSMIIHLKKYY